MRLLLARRSVSTSKFRSVVVELIKCSLIIMCIEHYYVEYLVYDLLLPNRHSGGHSAIPERLDSDGCWSHHDFNPVELFSRVAMFHLFNLFFFFGRSVCALPRPLFSPYLWIIISGFYRSMVFCIFFFILLCSLSCSSLFHLICSYLF